MRTGEPVRVEYRKYDGSLHWHLTLEWLGEDEHGRWLGGPAGTVMQRGYEPAVTLPYASVQLFPPDAWWTLSHNAERSTTDVYCDITTVPAWPEPDLVTMVDLDLDVIRRRDGSTFVDDEDEFAEHQVRYAYPDDVIAAAEASCRFLHRAVAAREEPFGAVAAAWLAHVPGPDWIDIGSAGLD